MSETSRSGAEAPRAPNGRRAPVRIVPTHVEPLDDGRRGKGGVTVARGRPPAGRVSASSHAVRRRAMGSHGAVVSDERRAGRGAAADQGGPSTDRPTDLPPDIVDAPALLRRVEELTRDNDRLRAQLAQLLEAPAPPLPARCGRPMKETARLRPRDAAGVDVVWMALIGLTGIAGAFMVLVATARFGPLVSPDSVQYLAATKDLLQDGDLRNLRLSLPPGRDYFLWPPLFPAAVALVSLGPGEAADAARYVNAAAFGATVVVAGWWLRRIGVARRWLVLGSLAVLFSFPLLFVSLWAWSESLFSLWLLLFAILLARYTESGSRRFLLAAAGCGALAWLTRYFGGFAIVLGLGTVLVRHHVAPRRAVVDAGLFGTIFALPSALWLVRNYLVASTWTGPRPPSQRPFGENVGLLLDTLGAWFMPGWVPPGWSPWIVAMAGIALTCAVGWLVLEPRVRPDRARETPPDIPILFMLVAIYTVYLVASATRFAFDPIDTRLLAPIAVPILLLAVAVGDRVDRHLPNVRWGWFPRTLMLAVGAGWLLVPASDVHALVQRAHANGAHGYGTDGWRTSEVVATLGQMPLDGRLVSNRPEPIIYLNEQPANHAPGRGDDQALAALADSARMAQTYLVWFSMPWLGEQSHLAPLNDLRTVVNLEPIVELEDGTIYRVVPRA